MKSKQPSHLRSIVAHIVLIILSFIVYQCNTVACGLTERIFRAAGKLFA